MTTIAPTVAALPTPCSGGATGGGPIQQVPPTGGANGSLDAQTTAELVQVLTQLTGVLGQLVQVLQAGQAVQPGVGAPGGPVQQAASSAAACGCGGMHGAGAAPGVADGQGSVQTFVNPEPAATTPAPQVPQGADPAPDQASPPGNGDLRQRIVEAARKEIGVHETGDNGGDQIVRYRRAVTGPGEDANLAEPWCADFASFVYQQAGSPAGVDGQGSDYVPQMMDWGRKTGRWRDRDGVDPKPGDMIVFDWEHDGTVDHVGIVERVENGRVHTIEGNSSDQVAERSYDLGSADITGYINAIG